MIAFIKGVVCSMHADSVVIDHQGIGFRIYTPNPQMIGMGKEVTLYTYQHVREDAIVLFGFSDMEEHDLFLRLLSVKGVGPKSALAILGACSLHQLIAAIEAGDTAFLKKLPGIGAKSASQIVLDLKGKLVETESETAPQAGNQNLNDALEALKALGYRPGEINAIQKELAKDQNKSVDEYVRTGLALMLKRKGV